MKFIVEEYCIASHYLGSLINADPTGLEDEEAADFDEWVKLVQDGRVGHWDCDRDSDIARCEVTGLLSDCTNVRFIYRVGVECEPPMLSHGNRLKPLVEGMNLNSLPPTIGMMLIKPLTDLTARAIMYDWHAGVGSALYAAASSGLVKSLPNLYREINAIDKTDRDLLTEWLHKWQEIERIVNYNGADYHALPWAKI